MHPSPRENYIAYFRTGRELTRPLPSYRRRGVITVNIARVNPPRPRGRNDDGRKVACARGAFDIIHGRPTREVISSTPSPSLSSYSLTREPTTPPRHTLNCLCSENLQKVSKSRDGRVYIRNCTRIFKILCMCVCVCVKKYKFNIVFQILNCVKDA